MTLNDLMLMMLFFHAEYVTTTYINSAFYPSRHQCEILGLVVIIWLQLGMTVFCGRFFTKFHWPVCQILQKFNILSSSI